MTQDRVAKAFAAAKVEGRICLLGYLPAGCPSEGRFAGTVRAAFGAGLDILELGLPCADPFLDGQVIRSEVARIRSEGMDEEAALALGSNLAAEAPLIAMMYDDSLKRLGGEASIARIAAMGYAGILVVGGFRDEAWWRASREAGLEPVGFAKGKPTQSSVAILAREARGFIYLPSREGKTGGRVAFGPELGERIRMVKAASGDLPVAVGFGINAPADVAALAELGADGAIVGTALVEAARDEDGLRDYVASLKRAAIGRRP